MILDFRDAFMSIGLDVAKRPFNACAFSRDLHRRRPRLHPEEPDSGRFIVWSVLGFGGKPNPLIFARVVSFASRSAQALLRPSADSPGCRRAGVGRLQTYVDDPVLTVLGDTVARQSAFDLVISWWLALGIPLAWQKGSVSSETHRWIGADFRYQRAPPDDPAVGSESSPAPRPSATGSGPAPLRSRPRAGRSPSTSLCPPLPSSRGPARSSSRRSASPRGQPPFQQAQGHGESARVHGADELVPG